MKIRQFGLLIILSLIIIGGCSNMTVDEYDNASQSLVLEEYFAGKTRAWGLFEDRMGNVRREFVVDIEGHWDGKTLTLKEDFVYSDGERETRTWTLIKTGPDTYSGSTENIIGDAVGRVAGNAFNWQYDFNLKVGDSFWKVHFNDWMFLQHDGVLLNKATVSRWGLKIGTVFISFNKQDEQMASNF